MYDVFLCHHAKRRDPSESDSFHKQSPIKNRLLSAISNSSNSVVPNPDITSQFAVLHSSELCSALSPNEGAGNNHERLPPRHPSSVVIWHPRTVAHVDVLPQLERHTAEPAATGGHLADDLPRVSLVTVSLNSVMISARKW